MIILDLTIFSIQNIGGISVVWSEYLKRLYQFNSEIKFSLIYSRNNNQIAKKLDLSPYNNVSIVKPRGALTKYFPFLLRGNRNDVLHTSYYQWYPFYKGTKIVTLHDFMHEKFAPLKSRLLHNVLKYLSLNSSDVVLCISEATKNDFKEIYPKIYANKDVRIIENAVGDEFYPDESNNEKKSFLWVAGRSGYKNFIYALRILSYLNKQGKKYDINVVGPNLTDLEINDAIQFGVLKQIKVFSNVSMDELRLMYSNALALLYLSKYEGFGLPILEAQKCHCPVIALKNPASLEIAKKSILYISDNDEDEILELVAIIESINLRDKIICDGVINSKRYNWDDSVEKLLAVYKEYQV